MFMGERKHPESGFKTYFCQTTQGIPQFYELLPKGVAYSEVRTESTDRNHSDIWKKSHPLEDLTSRTFECIFGCSTIVSKPRAPFCPSLANPKFLANGATLKRRMCHRGGLTSRWGQSATIQRIYKWFEKWKKRRSGSSFFEAISAWGCVSSGWSMQTPASAERFLWEPKSPFFCLEVIGGCIAPHGRSRRSNGFGRRNKIFLMIRGKSRFCMDPPDGNSSLSPRPGLHGHRDDAFYQSHLTCDPLLQENQWQRFWLLVLSSASETAVTTSALPERKYCLSVTGFLRKP